MPPTAKKKKPKAPATFTCPGCGRKGVPTGDGYTFPTGRVICPKCKAKRDEIVGSLPPPPPKVKRKTRREEPPPGPKRKGKKPPARPWQELQAEAAAAKADRPMWYVLQVEPGNDRKARKDLLRLSRINRLTNKVKRVIVPTKLAEVVVKPSAVTVAEGWDTDPVTCKHVGRRKAVELTPEELRGADGGSATPGLWVSVFEDDRKGWGWKVKKAGEGEPRRATRSVKKFKGYVFCKLVYDADTAALLKKTRYAWGLLLQPVVTNIKVVVKTSKATGMSWWVIRHPETNDELARSDRKYDTKAAAREAGLAKKTEMEEFRPTALRTKEEAEMLVAEQFVKDIRKDKAAMNKAVVNLKVGDQVEITGESAWRGKVGKLTVLDKTDPTNPVTKLEATHMGVPIELTIPYWDLKRVTA